jgi:hypothetical protein
VVPTVTCKHGQSREERAYDEGRDAARVEVVRYQTRVKLLDRRQRAAAFVLEGRADHLLPLFDCPTPGALASVVEALLPYLDGHEDHLREARRRLGGLAPATGAGGRLVGESVDPAHPRDDTR